MKIPDCAPAVSAMLSMITLFLCGQLQAAEAEQSPDKTVAAVWKSQEIGFHYQSFTTFYSCDALENRVEKILKAVGADRDLYVRSNGCPSGGIARLPYVLIRVTSPVEATPEAIAEIEKTRSKRELAARVRGEQMSDVGEQFPAHWQPVAFDRGRLRLEPGDCELMDQLVRYVFPKLAVRVTKNELSCSPNQVSFIQPRLDVDALFAIKPQDADSPAPAKR